MFIPLEIVERGRKSPVCADPHAGDAIPLWHFPLDHRRATEVRESPEQAQPQCKSRAGTLIRNEWQSLYGLWNSICISSRINTNLTKVKTMLNLPAHTPCWCNMVQCRCFQQSYLDLLQGWILSCLTLAVQALGVCPGLVTAAPLYSRERGGCICRASCPTYHKQLP